MYGSRPFTDQCSKSSECWVLTFNPHAMLQNEKKNAVRGNLDMEDKCNVNKRKSIYILWDKSGYHV